jgi:hypothetical protein
MSEITARRLRIPSRADRHDQWKTAVAWAWAIGTWAVALFIAVMLAVHWVT